MFLPIFISCILSHALSQPEHSWRNLSRPEVSWRKRLRECRISNWCNGDPFLSEFCDNHVSDTTITLDTNHCGACQGKQAAAGEVTCGDKIMYGTVATKMKPINKGGVISTIFLWPADTSNPVGEIDLEFLPGSYTDGFQANVCPCAKGCSTNDCQHAIPVHGLNPHDGNPHIIGFEWQSNFVKFYFDGRVVANYNSNIPNQPLNIMASVWACGASDWCGGFNTGGLPQTAYFEWIYYNSTGGPPPKN